MMSDEPISWVWAQLQKASREFHALPESVQRATDPSIRRVVVGESTDKTEDE